MKKLKLTLTLDVEYDLDGAEPSELRERLRQIWDEAHANGIVTDDLPATLDSFSLKIVGSDDLVWFDRWTGGPVSYDDPRDPATVEAWLRNIPGNSEICIDDDGRRLQVVGHEEIYLEIGGPPDTRKPFGIEDFVRHLSDAIDPEDAYRELLREFDERPDYGDGRCALEVRDRPAFRQGLNDYADSQMKDNQWRTFDNGNTYYTAEAIKEVIADHDESEYEYSPELRAIIDRWL
jgi:hypothetical protein